MKKTRQIDKIDSKLLSALLAESRASFTKLAEICGVSVTAVIRRYNRLKKTGTILGEHMYFNPLSVGYEAIAEIGIMTDLADREKAMHMLITQRAIRLASSVGKYDIYGLLMTKNLNDLDNLVRRIDIKPFVKSLDILLFAEMWANPWHPENIAVKASDRETFAPQSRKPISKFESISLDKNDILIAEMLMNNSRIAFKDIAEKVNISTKNVIQRYHILREKKALNLSTISLDIFKLGYRAILDVYLKVEHRGTLPEFEANLLQIPNSTFCAKLVGGAYDLRAAFIVATFDDVFRLRTQISSLKNIRTAEYYLHEIPGPWPNDFMGQSWLLQYHTT